MSFNPIQLWKIENAPEQYKSMAMFDRGWVAVVPKDYEGEELTGLLLSKKVHCLPMQDGQSLMSFSL